MPYFYYICTMELELHNEKIFIVSDLHVNHRKLCTSYEDHFDRTRKYVTVEEMNEDIVKQWNSVVSPNDIVIFLGDFTLGTPGSKLLEVFGDYYTNKLNFKHMYMIRGNHDYTLFKKLYPVKETMFPNITMVKDNIYLTYNGKNYLLQHYNYDETINEHDGTTGDPTALNQYLAEGKTVDYLVHGHTHEFNKTSIVDNHNGKMVENNVSWEAWYRPVSIDELVKTDAMWEK